MGIDLAFGVCCWCSARLAVFAFDSTLAMVTLNGVFFIVAGAAEIGVGMHARSWGRFFFWVIGGIFYIAAGVFCILDPVVASWRSDADARRGSDRRGVVRAYLGFQLPAQSRRWSWWAPR